MTNPITHNVSPSVFVFPSVLGVSGWGELRNIPPKAPKKYAGLVLRFAFWV
jgi:hypothetical protein